MPRFSMMIAFSVLAVVACNHVRASRAYPSSQENSTKDNANWTSLEKPEILAIEAVISGFCESDETMESINLLESFVPILVCLSSLVPWDMFMAELEEVTNETRSEFFPRYCPQLRTVEPCAQRVAKAVKPCLKEEDFTIVSALANVLPEVVEFICINDGEAFYSNYDPQYHKCLKSLERSATCHGAFEFHQRLYPSKFTRDQCGSFFKYQKCLQYPKRSCRTPDMPSIIDLFLNTLFRVTPCRDYVADPEVILINNITIN